MIVTVLKRLYSAVGDVVFSANILFLGQIDAHNPLQFLPRKGSTSSQSSRRTVSFEDTPSSPVLVIRTRTQARVVQDSLEKNQRANDDLFEL
ncbi:hypothetical protein BaRGS_00018796 [Batillaria attramentaria]|uniref:Uncharacterized protein n=1 Tax=Batillaria attramentaria TaxID=370345 RepID=A0ABD0KS62_9CAEN